MEWVVGPQRGWPGKAVIAIYIGTSNSILEVLHIRVWLCYPPINNVTGQL